MATLDEDLTLDEIDAIDDIIQQMLDAHAYQEHFYADTMESIHVNAGMIYLNFADALPPDNGNLDTGTIPAMRVAMPLSGFLYACGIFAEFLENDDVQTIISAMQHVGILPKEQA